jgi:hypothetical protein
MPTDSKELLTVSEILMKVKSINHSFDVQVEERPIVHLRAKLNYDLFSAIKAYSSGFLRIETKSTLSTLRRLKERTKAEDELMEIIINTLNKTEYAECFIVFRK